MMRLMLLGILAASAILAEPITYRVTVNTGAISGTSGFLDFDFAPGSDSQSAFVTISDFSPGGSLTGLPQVNGGVSGSLPGTLTIHDSTQFNDYFQGFNFGPSSTFLLSFSGPALTSPNHTSTSGSTFGFGMFDRMGTNPLLTTDPNGNAFTVEVNLDGTTTTSAFSSAATLQQSTPEPSELVALALCLAAIALTHRRINSEKLWPGA
jgi:hypothetical protein